MPAAGFRITPRNLLNRALIRLLALSIALLGLGAARAATPAPAAALADAATSLAADDLAGYRKIQPTLCIALDAYMATAKAALKKSGADLVPDREDIDATRADFAVVSTAAVDLLRASGVDAQLKLKTFQSPMAPVVVGKGRWFQREGGTKNPFFGSSMLRCGSELSAKRISATLPTGHPAIDHLTPDEVAPYLAKRKTADECCGN